MKIELISKLKWFALIAMVVVGSYFLSPIDVSANCCNPCAVCTTPFCPPPCFVPPPPTPVPGTFNSINLSPGTPDASATVTGNLNGSELDGLCSNFKYTKSEYAASGATYSIDGGSASGFSLNQTAAGVNSSCGTPTAQNYSYNFSFPLNTSGLSNGSHSITFNASSTEGVTAYSTTFSVFHVPPPTGTINVTSDRNPVSSGMSWYLSGPNNYTDNNVSSATHSGAATGTYTLQKSSSSSSIPYAFNVSNSGASCSTSQTCTLASTGTINYTLASTFCTITVNTTVNGSSASVSGLNYTLSGPLNTYSNKTTAQTFSANTRDDNNVIGPLADSSGSTFTVNYTGASTLTIGGYVDAYTGITSAASQSCNAGGSLTFTINFQSEPVLRIY